VRYMISGQATWCGVYFSPCILAHGTVPGPGTYTLLTQCITILTHTLLRYIVCQVTPIMTSEPAMHMGKFEKSVGHM